MWLSSLSWAMSQLPQIKGSATKLVFLIMNINSQSDKVEIAIRDFALSYGIPESTILASLKVLENRGLVQRIRKGNQHVSSLWKVCVTLDTRDSVYYESINTRDSASETLTSIDSQKNEKRPITTKDSNNSYKSINKSINKKSWVKILLKDKRVKLDDITQSWVDRIEAQFGHLDLELESDACVDYLASKPKYKSVKATFLNWLKRSSSYQSKPQSFNAHEGGNMAEILQFAKEQE